MSTLELFAETRSDASMLRLVGEADYGTIVQLERAMTTSVEDGAGTLIVDLTAVEFIDSTVVALLIRTHRRLADDGRALTVLVGPPQVQKMLDMTGGEHALHVVRAPAR